LTARATFNPRGLKNPVQEFEGNGKRNIFGKVRYKPNERWYIESSAGKNFVLPKPSSIKSLRNRGLLFFVLPTRFSLFSHPAKHIHEN
jgi:hypothetical protein